MRSKKSSGLTCGRSMLTAVHRNTIHPVIRYIVPNKREGIRKFCPNGVRAHGRNRHFARLSASAMNRTRAVIKLHCTCRVLQNRNRRAISAVYIRRRIQLHAKAASLCAMIIVASLSDTSSPGAAVDDVGLNASKTHLYMLSNENDDCIRSLAAFPSR